MSLNQKNGPYAALLSLPNVKGTPATLGFTRFPRTCIIEIDGPFSGRSAYFHQRAWAAFATAGIPHTFHWGRPSPPTRAPAQQLRRGGRRLAHRAPHRARARRAPALLQRLHTDALGCRSDTHAPPGTMNRISRRAAAPRPQRLSASPRRCVTPSPSSVRPATPEAAMSRPHRQARPAGHDHAGRDLPADDLPLPEHLDPPHVRPCRRRPARPAAPHGRGVAGLRPVDDGRLRLLGARPRVADGGRRIRSGRRAGPTGWPGPTPTRPPSSARCRCWRPRHQRLLGFFFYRAYLRYSREARQGDAPPS